MKQQKKNKKITNGDGFSVGDTGSLSVSLASLADLVSDKNVQTNIAEYTKTAASATEHIKGTAVESSRISKVALRRERAGRGGKAVTIVTLPSDYRGDREALARELRKGLGCGSSMETGNIVLQGDIIDRAEGFFKKKGVAKITKSI
ncbi:MAG: translation initiation factor [Synergistes sp.]|nr:translation initiation factor [Synergistes sp.]